MKMQRFALALTVGNILLLTFLVARSPSTADEIAPVLRGRALEIVDDSGKVRASIKVCRPIQPLKCRMARSDIQRLCCFGWSPRMDDQT